VRPRYRVYFLKGSHDGVVPLVADRSSGAGVGSVSPQAVRHFRSAIVQPLPCCSATRRRRRARYRRWARQTGRRLVGSPEPETNAAMFAITIAPYIRGRVGRGRGLCVVEDEQASTRPPPFSAGKCGSPSRLHLEPEDREVPKNSACAAGSSGGTHGSDDAQDLSPTMEVARYRRGSVHSRSAEDWPGPSAFVA